MRAGTGNMRMETGGKFVSCSVACALQTSPRSPRQQRSFEATVNHLLSSSHVSRGS